MTANVITTATDTGGGVLLVSFGSGNEGGRLAASARGRGGQQTAGPGQVRAVRARINRMQGLSARRRRQLLQEIDDNRSARGNIRRSVLRDINDALDEL